MCSTELSQVRCWKSVKVWGVTGVMKKGYKLVKITFKEPVYLLGEVIRGVLIKDFSLQLCGVLQTSYEIKLAYEGNKYRIKIGNEWVTCCESYAEAECKTAY